MTALGQRFEDLEYKDIMALTDLYAVMPGTQREADEAAGSPALSHAPARSMKDSLSSPGDDLSLDGTSLGEDSGLKPAVVEVPLPVKPQGKGPR